MISEAIQTLVQWLLGETPSGSGSGPTKMQKIIVALGIDIRDRFPSLFAFLNEEADHSFYQDSVWTYPKGAGSKATIEVSIIYTKEEFVKALDTDGAYVIYHGHSRYGQGPAFGPARPPDVPFDGTKPWIPDKKAFPVNPWGVHFRMGYDAVYTPAIEDLLEHSVTPAEFNLLNPSQDAFLGPGLKATSGKVIKTEERIKRGEIKSGDLCRDRKLLTLYKDKDLRAWLLFDTCHPSLASKKTARDDQPLNGRHYYYYYLRYDRDEKEKAKQNLKDEYRVSVQVGSGDLNNSKLKCKVLYMDSCVSRDYFYKALARRRKDISSACKFFLTRRESKVDAMPFIVGIFNGVDPVRNSDVMLEILNTLSDSGGVGIY